MQNCRDHIVYSFFVGHAVSEIDELWQHIYLVCGFQNRTKFVSLTEAALLYDISQIGELWHMQEIFGSSGGAKMLKGVKCNACLVHRLTERHKIWHDKGNLYIAGYLLYFGELWPTFSGSKHFLTADISDIFLSQGDEICHSYRSGQSTLISRISLTLVHASRDTVRRLASVLH